MRWAWVLAAALFVGIAPGFAHGQVPREELSAPLTAEEFVRRAAQEAMGDAEIGRMVASDPTLPHEVQLLGRAVAERASAAQTELRALAERHGVPLTGALTDEDSRIIQDLSRIQGAEFTERYVERMVTALGRHVRLHERALEMDQPDIRDYAGRALAALRQQHAAAGRLWDQEVAGEAPGD